MHRLEIAIEHKYALVGYETHGILNKQNIIIHDVNKKAAMKNIPQKKVFTVFFGFFLTAFFSLAHANVWSCEKKDASGTSVLYVTNIQPRGKDASHCKVAFRTGPAKAQLGSAVSGGWSCKESRNDVVPARDKSPERTHRYDAFIQEASVTYHIPEALIRAVIQTESDYDPRVVSCAGAKGLMQLMPYEENGIDVFDPRQNILTGTYLLRKYADQFQGDLAKVVASHHAGSPTVKRYNGVPPYDTTQWYVSMVLKRYMKNKTV